MQKTTTQDDLLSPDFSSPLEYLTTSNHIDQTTPPLDTDDPWKMTFNDLSIRNKQQHPFTDSSSSSRGSSPDSESQQQQVAFSDVLRDHDVEQESPLYYSASLSASNVLAATEVPAQYTDHFNAVKTIQNRYVDIPTLESLLTQTRIQKNIRQQIISLIVTPDKSDPLVTRDEFNAYQALVGCAQSSMDVSLETVYQNRHNLPIPHFDTLNTGMTIADPLTSDCHTKRSDSMSRSTTSLTINGPLEEGSKARKADEERLIQGLRTIEYRQEQEAMNTWLLNVDRINVSRAPVKEGFLLKHVNYEIESEKLGTKVLRRYSDFWWLWETLLKRYPFRVVPNLPPKRVGGRTDLFEEQRRKGLKRFINAVVSHPVLGRDDIVKAFLTHPSELSHWRRKNSPSFDEEFVRIPHDIARYERLIPVDVIDRVNQVRKKLPTSIQQHHKLCLSMEHIIKSKQALGIGYTHYGTSLNSIRKLEEICWLSDCQACPQVTKGYDSVAKSMQQAGSILIKQAAVAGEIILEGLRRQRDLLESLKELLSRSEKSITTVTEALLSSQMAKHKKGELQPYTAHDEPHFTADNSMMSDGGINTLTGSMAKGMSLVRQRDIFIKYCLVSELSYTHKLQANVSQMYSDFVRSEIQNAKQWCEHWKILGTTTDDMPSAPQEFL